MNTFTFTPSTGPSLSFASLDAFYAWKRENLPLGTTVHGTSVNDGCTEFGKLVDDQWAGR